MTGRDAYLAAWRHLGEKSEDPPGHDDSPLKSELLEKMRGLGAEVVTVDDIDAALSDIGFGDLATRRRLATDLMERLAVRVNEGDDTH